MLVSNSVICDRKKSRFIKNQEASRLLSKLGMRTPLRDFLLIGDISFYDLIIFKIYNDYFIIIFKMIILK